MISTKCLLLFFIIFKSSEESDQKPCVPRSYGLSSIVCVCNSTYCDTLLQPPPITKGQYLSYTSTESGLRFKLDVKDNFQTKSQNNKVSDTININLEKKYQTIIGWGGAFTDSTGINLESLTSTAADYLLKSYFSEEGLEYNLCRVPIGGTDFSTHGYSYNDGEEDPELLNFKLAPADHKYKIPVIKAARNLTNGMLELFASAWTAPKWMKKNGEYTGPDFLKRKMYQSWANYHLKFLEAYKAEGINFWGITTGNEPSTGLIPSEINSVGWLPWQMRKWVSNHFGPAIRNSEFSSLKILTVDDQAFFYTWYIDMMFEDKKVKDYIDGFGLHWYWNNLFPASLLTKTHNKYPNKFILATEACEGSKFYEQHVLLGEWRRAENYANDIINDLNNWVTGWIDWNMALDLTGGPTYISNNVDSPIIVNATAGEFYKQPMYYALGHFTKFIPKGSERLGVTQANKEVSIVAFKRPDNQTVVVILNQNKYEVEIKISTDLWTINSHTVPSKSITTILY